MKRVHEILAGDKKGLNGSSPSHGHPSPEPAADRSRGLIEELAQALNRQTPQGTQPVGSVSAHPVLLPAIATAVDYDDDLPDDAPVPIPSTWRNDGAPPESVWMSDQARAALYGFGAGLVVVVPAVLLLTGRIGGLPGFGGYSQSAGAPPVIATAEVQPVHSDGIVRQRTVATTVVAPTPVERSAPEPATRPAETVQATVTAALPARDEGAELRAEGVRRVAAGDIAGARDVLARSAATGDVAALLALAETFDPNMLAAWSARGVSADVGRARALYARALAAGLAQAKLRLDALQ